MRRSLLKQIMPAGKAEPFRTVRRQSRKESVFMIQTCGLTHIHLMVKDIQRSLDFYQTVFGMEVKFWAGKGLVFLNTPGSNDMIALHQADEGRATGASGGILHFGLQLENKDDLEQAIN